MKKNLFSALVTLPCCCFVLNACTPDGPPENIPRYIDGLQFNPEYFQGPGVLTAISPTPCLPGQGSCTMILPSSPSLSQDMGVAFSNFKRYYYKKDLAGFFSSTKNWDKLFPGLQHCPGTLKEIVDGTCKVQVANDGKAIVFYKGQSPETGKIIKAYWLNKY